MAKSEAYFQNVNMCMNFYNVLKLLRYTLFNTFYVKIWFHEYLLFSDKEGTTGAYDKIYIEISQMLDK